MLSLLPQILFLAPLAPALLRVLVALYLAYDAWVLVSRQDVAVRMYACVEVAVAAALFVGAWTQAFALGLAAMLLLSLVLPQFRSYPKSVVSLLLSIALSLVVTGPGAIAFDLPL